MPAKPSHPVIWAPSHEFIGFATTQRGALNVAAKVPLQFPHRERRTANLAQLIDCDEYPDGTLAWFCGPQLVTR